MVIDVLGIDLTNKRFAAFGLMGSGKTELVKWILRSSPGSVVYDPVNDYIGYRRYTPTDRQSEAELSEFILEWVWVKRPPLFVVDEANKYIQPKPSRLPKGLADLNDLSRHIGTAWGVVARRPSQLHSDVLELAHYLFIFHLPGPKDKKILNEMAPGMGDDVHSLKDHYFVVYEQGRGYYIHNPIPWPPPEIEVK